MYSDRPPHFAEQKQDDQHEPTYSSSERYGGVVSESQGYPIIYIYIWSYIYIYNYPYHQVKLIDQRCVHKRTTQTQMVWPYFFSKAPHVFSFLYVWFERWETSGHSVAVLWDAASRTCSEQHIASFYSFHQGFSLSVLKESWQRILTVVPTQPQLGRIILSIYQRDQISKWSPTFTRRMLWSLSVDEILLLSYVN